MKSLVLSLNTVLASLAVPQPAPSVAKVVKVDNPPIVGLWRLHLEKAKDCTEDYNFKSDRKLSVVSGAEWTHGSYDLIYKEKSLPILILKTAFDDNNVDCSGVQRDQTGEHFAAYIKQNSDNEFELCERDDGKNCFMRFNRILPY